MTAVAFFADANVVVALHVAMASTLAHWRGPDALEIHLFHDGLTGGDLERLRKTVELSGASAVLRDAVFDLARVRSWRSLYGSHMPYGRLFLPELLPDADEVLYLDADVVVEIDVREVIRARGEEAVSAMKAWDFAHSHDMALASELGIAGDEPYFHSGLLVLRLEQWRAEHLLARCLEIGDRYGERLMSHDQTILNLACRGRIAPLPGALTSHLYPTPTPGVPYAEGKIQNFCGSPKPFDPFGNVLNAHFPLFQRWLRRTALAGWSPNSVEQFHHVKRNVRLLKPMLRTVATRVVNAIRKPRQNGAK